MTRRRDLMCEDIFGCDHKAETPIVENGAIVYWTCRCGEKRIQPEKQSDEAKEGKPQG